MNGGSRATDGSSVGRGVLLIVLAGIVLGLGFNKVGLGKRALPWVGEDRVAALPKLEEVSPPEAPPSGTVPAAPEGGYVDSSDPMAVGAAGSAAAGLPEIPDLNRPVQIQLAAAKQLFDANAALFVDARDPEEFAEGHIPGALNLPVDEVLSEPERLDAVDAGGRAIVAYCGGGACELSLDLAEELIFAGKHKVTVYMGGFPEWAGAGYPVAKGS